MKRNLKKVVAAALAMTMCVPAMAFAQEGTFETSFDVYSPVLTISVPTKLDIEVNPIADSNASGLKKFTVASNSIDIANASVDVEKDVAIPVNVTVKASIASKKEGVITNYNTFIADPTSTKKKINLNLSQAQTAAALAVKSGETAAFDTDKKLDLSKFEVGTPAVYTTPAQSTAITQYGSLLSMDILGPSTVNSTAGATYSTVAADVTAAVGSFAVTGTANTNADWKADDVTVAVTYNVKASRSLSITTPTIAAAPAFTAGASATDVSITVPNVGEATVTAMALHNDSEGAYGDVIWESSSYKVVYAENSTTNKTDATITIAKDDAFLKVLTDGFSGKAQDLVIQLSDGRYVITTLTATAATTP